MQAPRRAAEAIPLYEQAARLSPDEAGIYNLTGGAFVQLRMADKASDCLEHALRINPSVPKRTTISARFICSASRKTRLCRASAKPSVCSLP